MRSRIGIERLKRDERGSGKKNGDEYNVDGSVRGTRKNKE